MSHSPRRILSIPLPVETRVAADDARFLGYLQDVSVTGAFVQSCAPRPPGTCLSIRLRLPGLAVPLECPQAEVVWSRPYQGRGGPAPGMGVRLRRLTPEVRTQIRRFCEAPRIETAPKRPSPAMPAKAPVGIARAHAVMPHGDAAATLPRR
jgi:hypothetical protein